jgi:hypothetical protein
MLFVFMNTSMSIEYPGICAKDLAQAIKPDNSLNYMYNKTWMTQVYPGIVWYEMYTACNLSWTDLDLNQHLIYL